MLAWLHGFFKDFATLFYGFSISRAIYTLIVLLIIMFLVRDLILLWGRPTLYLGQFEYYDGGKSNPDRANQLRAEAVHKYKAFLETIDREAKERVANITGPAQGLEFELARIVEATSQFSPERLPDLSTLELSVQGVNVQKILTYFSSLLERSPAITATVVRENNTSRVLLEYPRKVLPTETGAAPRVDLSTLADDTNTAAAVACSLVWTQFSSRTRARDAAFDDFCQCIQAIHLKHVSDTTSRNYFETGHAENAAFVRNYIKRAAAGKIQYGEAYLAAADLAARDASGMLKVSDSLSINHPILAPYLRYLYLRYSKSKQGGGDALHDAAAFYKSLEQAKGLSIDSSVALANAFIAPRISKLCAVSQATNGYLDHVVRLKIVEPHGVEEWTGTVIGPGLVIAPNVKLLQWAKYGGSISNVRVETVDCAGRVTDHLISKATPLVFDKEGIFDGLEAALLRVPTVGQGLPSIDSSSISAASNLEGREVTMIGYTSYAAKWVEDWKFNAPRRQPTGKSDIYLVQGRILNAREDTFIYRKGIYLTNDAIVADGMVGSPLFDGKELVGVQVYLNYSGGWWPLSRALPMDRIVQAVKSADGAK